MDANFTQGRRVGNQLVPTGSLNGGVSSEQMPRVRSLAEKMTSPGGYFSRIIADHEGNVLEGQHRLEAARHLNLSHVPIVRVRDAMAGMPPEPAMRAAFDAAKPTHRDHQTQLMGQLADRYAEEGSVAKIRRNWAPPQGFEPQWEAGLSAMAKHEAANKRPKRAAGGHVPHPHFVHPTTHFHAGPIHSGVAGRTDHLPMHVASGSYVLPADVVSAHGEGNTVAGFKVLRRVFGGTPYGGHGGPYGSGNGPYGQPLATGGATKGVPIVAAGGEYVLTPDQVRAVGGGDLDKGHRVLDEFVLRSRKELVGTLKKLPGPAKG